MVNTIVHSFQGILRIVMYVPLGEGGDHRIPKVPAFDHQIIHAPVRRGGHQKRPRKSNPNDAIWSPSSRFDPTMQLDCSSVVFGDSERNVAIWASNLHRSPSARRWQCRALRHGLERCAMEYANKEFEIVAAIICREGTPPEFTMLEAVLRLESVRWMVEKAMGARCHLLLTLLCSTEKKSDDSCTLPVSE
ncbi:hypothetical protein AXG93_3823s1040 [Marchantia polymorpha subsp. ruderalis]|uniref:Uncharacterized protein n=1 Tax=Marchantia polymorpha subsp. ruderalis TaxID=1480154 RepID=A0A176WRI1_MARPO|nr:hypothetical protein AXG93_3823s1040 [Marchantia polymorpha subsp. ruderalis]